MPLFSRFFKTGYILELNPLWDSGCAAVIQRPNGKAIAVLALLPESECPMGRRNLSIPSPESQRSSRKHVPFGHSCSTRRAGWKENQLYSVSSCNDLPLAVLSLPVARAHSPGTFKHSEVSRAGCQSASGAPLSPLCPVATPLSIYVNLHSDLLLVHRVVLPRTCLPAAVTHNLILSCCVRVGDWWLGVG